MPAVDAARRDELLSAEEPQRDAELRAEQVLAAFAARQGEVRDLGAHLTRDERQEPVVFVVGVSADDEKPLVDRKLLQQTVERDEAACRRRFERVAGGGSGLRPRRRETEKDEYEGERGSSHPEEV